jgi:serine protease Do
MGSTRSSDMGGSGLERSRGYLGGCPERPLPLGRKIMYASICKRYAAIACMCFLVGAGGDGAFNVAFGARKAPLWTETSPRQTARVQAPNFADVAEQLKPAVVNISTTQVVKGPQPGFRGPLPPRPFDERNPFSELFEHFFRGSAGQREVRRGSLGSGFIIGKDGYIVTNNHVVEDATDIKVSLADSEEFDAKLVGRDPQTEVALLKIEAQRDFPVVPLGDSDKLRVGEWVIAIGNPFGLGQTVTAGIASAKGRILGAGAYDDFIQTDASINPGNSGGPLFNLHGEVVGINTAIVPTGQGIGFAIPINLAKEVLTQLRLKGVVSRGFLGVQVQQVAPALARSFGLERPRGALVAYVQPDSPGERAGIEKGDVIVEFNGRKIADMHEFPRFVANTPPGSTAAVRFIRQGRERMVQVNIGDMPAEPRQALGIGTPDEELGLTVQELKAETAHELGLPKGQVVVVTDIEEGSPADEGGMSRGDLILEVNQQQVTNLRDFQAALGRSADAKSVLFLIRRGDNIVYVALRPEA